MCVEMYRKKKSMGTKQSIRV